MEGKSRIAKLGEGFGEEVQAGSGFEAAQMEM
jgi:hypothetical protein